MTLFRYLKHVVNYYYFRGLPLTKDLYGQGVIKILLSISTFTQLFIFLDMYHVYLTQYFISFRIDPCRHFNRYAEISALPLAATILINLFLLHYQQIRNHFRQLIFNIIIKLRIILIKQLSF